jgi:Spy/CpxP family protein refolding chaperone
MKMNRISLVIILAVGGLLAFNPVLRAAEEKEAKKSEGRKEGRGAVMQERMDKMTTELKLTDEQKQKVQAAWKERAEKMRGLRDATPEERREKGKAAMDEYDKKMKEILTSEQYEKWSKMAQGNREKGQDRGKGKKGGESKGGAGGKSK